MRCVGWGDARFSTVGFNQRGASDALLYDLSLSADRTLLFLLLWLSLPQRYHCPRCSMEHITRKAGRQGTWARPSPPQRTRAEWARFPALWMRTGCVQRLYSVMRNLHDGLDRRRQPTGSPRISQTPRLVHVGDDLTQMLTATLLSPLPVDKDARALPGKDRPHANSTTPYTPLTEEGRRA